MPRVIITHGAFGSCESDWIPWLRDELLSRSVEVIAPNYPTPEGQDLAEWLAIYERAVPAMDCPTVFVGHSIGATFTLRLLERQEGNILGTFLVAGVVSHLTKPDFRPLMASFVEPPFKWKLIRKRAGQIRIFHSADDPVVPIDKGFELSGKLGVPLLEFTEAGHFTSDSGYGPFPELLDQVLACLGV
jgi:uncharacterized protein